jgi:hypothetical protein
MTMPRDGGDPEETIDLAVPERRRGRRVPPPAAEPDGLVDIKVDGVLLGTVDTAELTMDAQFQLEEARTATALLDWLETHAGADRKAVRKALGSMKLPALYDLAEEIAGAIGEALAVDPRRRRRS